MSLAVRLRAGRPMIQVAIPLGDDFARRVQVSVPALPAIQRDTRDS